MSQSEDEVSQMLDNLAAIKEGKDPRDRSESTSAQVETKTSTETTTPSTQEEDRLLLAESEVDRLFEEHNLERYIPRERVHVGVAQWDRRNGVCKYNRMLDDQHRFGKRMTNIPRIADNHVIVINERLESDEQFIDTVRHELAHVVAYAEYGTSQKHNQNWKSWARRLDADPSACHNKKKGGGSSGSSQNYKYVVCCTNCGKEYTRKQRSKIVKKPFTRACGECGHGPLSSYDAGDEAPTESGVVAVESIPWDDQDDWYERS